MLSSTRERIIRPYKACSEESIEHITNTSSMSCLKTQVIPNKVTNVTPMFIFTSFQVDVLFTHVLLIVVVVMWLWLWSSGCGQVVVAVVVVVVNYKGLTRE